ncbi:MAG: xanthine dehydrogenase family protein subunit M [Planctomyces sp.]|nr:xanthine dehydrogenase family protein subunit M [Planctomyces sp.]
MRDFEYESPTTLPEALAILATGPGCRPLAGGTDLIDHVRVGRLAPDVLVDVKKLPELNILEAGPKGLRIGAATPCFRIVAHEAIQRDYAALADSAHIIGGIQIQNRATFGGNVCTSGPAADSIPSLIALSAACVIAGPQGTRRVPIEQFCTGPGKNVLQPGELLVEFELPAPGPHSGSHYRRFIPRNEMDIAVVGVGAAVTLDAGGQTITAARIALGAVAPTPLLAEQAAQAVIGQPVGESTFQAAGRAAREIISPITDMRGTAEFRTHVTGVLVERVLQAAVSRARGGRS